MPRSDVESRSDQLVRMMNLIRFIGRRAMTRQELADALGVTERTVRRYIYACRRAGIDVEQFCSEERGNPMMYAIRLSTWIGIVGQEPEPESVSRRSRRYIVA